MNTIIRISILLLCMLCISLQIQAQNDKSSKHKKWRQGFVVTIHDDTIHGKMRDEINPPFYDMQYELAFDDQSGITHHYTPDSLKSVTIYRSHDERTDTAVYISINVEDKQIGHAFFRLYVWGECKIYGYTTVVPTGVSSIRNVEYKYIKLGTSLVPPARIRFRKDMQELFYMCPVIVSKLESGTYTYANWEQLVYDYNKGLCK